MSTSVNDNNRIARNTLMLYIRMGVTMLVQLYTSRVVLEVLGIDDYGIWSLVATLVVSISFITAPLSTATQRFISYELGANNENKARLVFSQSIILYAAFSFAIIMLLETAGLWFLNYKLNIPNDKITITNIVYQFSILSFVVTLLKLPYDATIIAYEKMDFYAYMSILDVAMRLGIVFMLKAFNSIPHLVLYALLVFGVSVIMTFSYKIYCNKKYPITHIVFKIEKSVMRKMASFSGWSLMGSFAVMTANQGVNMVLNIFFGVAINATMGIANQVGNAVNQFVSNFQLAFQPPIVKAYARNEETQFINLIFNCAKISFLLMFLVITPLVFNMEAVLTLWLGKIPEYLPIFCKLTLLYMLIDTLSMALNIGIYANGNLRTYQILIATTILLLLPVSYFLLKQGVPPQYVLWARVIISVVTLFIRVFILNGYVLASIIKQSLTLIAKMALIILLAWSIPYIIINLIDINQIGCIIIELCWTCLMIWQLGLNTKEKKMITNVITRFL